MAAGLSKLFRPAAPSSLGKGSSKVQTLKGGGASRGEEIMSDSSSVPIVVSCVAVADAKVLSDKNVDHKDRHAVEVIPTGYRQDIAETYEENAGPSELKQGANSLGTSANAGPSELNHGANSLGTSATEWSQLPGTIPDPIEKDHNIVVKQKTPPPVDDLKLKPSALDGKAIKPEDVQNVPQPSKLFVRDVRARRVMKEFRSVSKICKQPDSIFNVELIEDNLYEWNIKLFEVDPLSLLHYDMEKRDIPFILFNMSFPDNFPFNPPFIRVVSPKIENGYVMDGGAICMELLTPGGWSSAYTIEAVVMQLGATLVAGHARLSKGKKYRIFGDVPFTRQDAMDSYRNIVDTHKKYGWHTPAGQFS